MLISFGSGNWSGTIPILRQEQFCRGQVNLFMILVQRISEELLGLELTSSNLWPDGRGCHEWNFNGFICYQTQNRHWSWKTESESSIDMGNLLASKEQKIKLLRPSWRLLFRHLISGGSCNTSASRDRSFLSIRKSTLESAYRPQNGGRIDVKTWYR